MSPEERNNPFADNSPYIDPEDKDECSGGLVAVVAEALGNPWHDQLRRSLAQDVLATLAAAGYAVVRVPEGVAVAHGARLHAEELYGLPMLYIIEATP